MPAGILLFISLYQKYQQRRAWQLSGSSSSHMCSIPAHPNILQWQVTFVSREGDLFILLWNVSDLALDLVWLYLLPWLFKYLLCASAKERLEPESVWDTKEETTWRHTTKRTLRQSLDLFLVRRIYQPQSLISSLFPAGSKTTKQGQIN